MQWLVRRQRLCSFSSSLEPARPPGFDRFPEYVMPKPHGTYAHLKRRDRIMYRAREEKPLLGASRQSAMERFHRELDKIALVEVEQWHRDLAALLDRVGSGESMSLDGRKLDYVSDVLGEVRGMLERIQDYKQLEGRLQLPVGHVMRAPAQGSSGIDIALVIALFSILEVMVQLLRKKKGRRA